MITNKGIRAILLASTLLVSVNSFAFVGSLAGVGGKAIEGVKTLQQVTMIKATLEKHGKTFDEFDKKFESLHKLKDVAKDMKKLNDIYKQGKEMSNAVSGIKYGKKIDIQQINSLYRKAREAYPMIKGLQGDAYDEKEKISREKAYKIYFANNFENAQSYMNKKGAYSFAKDTYKNGMELSAHTMRNAEANTKELSDLAESASKSKSVKESLDILNQMVAKLAILQEEQNVLMGKLLEVQVSAHSLNHYSGMFGEEVSSKKSPKDQILEEYAQKRKARNKEY